MKKLLLSLFSIFILLVYPVQAKEMVVPTIVGDDDREPITGKASKAEQAVVVIEKETESKYGLCSGAMVGPNLVLTAAHCINYDKEDPIIGIKVYAVGMPKSKIFQNENGKENSANAIKNAIKKTRHLTREIKDWSLHIYPLAEAKQVWIPKEFIQGVLNNKILSRNCNDYGLIILDHNLGDMTGLLGLKALSDENLENADITVIGRGGDKPDRTLWRSPGQTNEKIIISCEFSHNADTLSGNSGGPVFKKDDPTNIIGLNNWGEEKEYTEEGYPNYALRINQDIIDLVKNRDNPDFKKLYQIYSLADGKMIDLLDPKSLPDSYDREEITGKVSNPEQSIVTIEVTSLSRSWKCSGVMVGPNIVLTSAYCTAAADKIKVYAVGILKSQILPKIDEQDDPSEVPGLVKNILKNGILEKTKEKQSIYPSAIAKQIWVPLTYLRSKKAYNYSIIILDHNLGDMTGWLGLKAMSDEELENTNIMAIGYREEKPYYTLWKSQGHINKIDSIMMFHDSHIPIGNRGGPIFKDDDHTKIIALTDGPADGEGYGALRIRRDIIDLIKNRDYPAILNQYYILHRR